MKLRIVEARLLAAVRRSQFKAALRKAARFCGAWPRQMVQRSSSRTTSRTQWVPFSIALQCPRTIVRSRAASA